MRGYCELCDRYRAIEMRGGQVLCRPCAESMDAEHDAAYQRDREAALREDEDERRRDAYRLMGITVDSADDREG